jgi:hypothetical protein
VAANLPPLASEEDVVALLGRDLTPAEAVRCTALLGIASARVRRYCRRDFRYHAADTLTHYATHGVIRLAGPPIWSVASVKAVGNPSLGIPDFPLPWFQFNKIDEVTIDTECAPIMNLPELWAEFFSAGANPTYDVTYEHGPHEVPDEVNGFIAQAVTSVLTAPVTGAGVIGEQIGDYSWRGERGGTGMQVAITRAMLDEQLGDFRDKGNSIALVMR